MALRALQQHLWKWLQHQILLGLVSAVAKFLPRLKNFIHIHHAIARQIMNQKTVVRTGTLVMQQALVVTLVAKSVVSHSREKNICFNIGNSTLVKGHMSVCLVGRRLVARSIWSDMLYRTRDRRCTVATCAAKVLVERTTYTNIAKHMV